MKNYINAYISHPIRDRNVKTKYDVYLYDINMVVTTNHKYDSSSNYYHKYDSSSNYHIDGTEFEKFSKSNISIFSHFRSMTCRVEANNRKVVVVCVRHVAKRPSKRSALVQINCVLIV